MKYLFFVLIILFVIFYLNFPLKIEGFKDSDLVYDIYRGIMPERNQNPYTTDIDANYGRKPENFDYDDSQYIQGSLKKNLLNDGTAFPVNNDIDCYRKCFYIDKCTTFEYDPSKKTCILGSQNSKKVDGNNYIYSAKIDDSSVKNSDL